LQTVFFTVASRRQISVNVTPTTIDFAWQLNMVCIAMRSPAVRHRSYGVALELMLSIDFDETHFDFL
jgi:hypothetical protein